MTSRAISHCIIVLVCLSLSGCFKSDVALVDPSNADWPFKQATILLKDGDETRTYHLEQGAPGYGLVNLPEVEKQMRDGRILFYKVQSDLLIMQWQDGPGATYDFFIIKLYNDKFTMDTCSAYKDETLSRLDLHRELGECSIANIGQLARLAQIPPDDGDRKFTAGEIRVEEAVGNSARE